MAKPMSDGKWQRFVSYGRTLAEAYGARNAVPGELLVRLTVEKVVGYTGISD
ncbi:hypothetical protein AB0873_18175 [Micromonospora sp. NPDC047707]|uniref:hypothetical protein n=1 Tax=Micromonospora sp. NPDC047707 TaxID=3154498 RepID=UPI00345120ED